MSDYRFALARPDQRQEITDFVNAHWGSRHQLINADAYFRYYYLPEAGDSLHFALAWQGHRIAAAAGFIPASSAPRPDLWVSIWIADKACRGSGLELMEALPALTGCRTLACNNIRPETMPFYAFLGYETGRVSHYYRLAPREEYRIAKVNMPVYTPINGCAALTNLLGENALYSCGFSPSSHANPFKDLSYIARRYFRFPAHPGHEYRLYAAALPGEAAPRALLAVRVADTGEARALRIVDYIGPEDFFPELGPAIDALMAEAGAEYADLYCVGLAEETLGRGGFLPRLPESDIVIPNYLAPLRRENTEYYYFTSRPEGFTLFRADGDQDRPHWNGPDADEPHPAPRGGVSDQGNAASGGDSDP